MNSKSTRAAANARADYTAGLRRLADILDAHPDVPLPYQGSATPMTFHFLSAADPKGDLARMARVFPGPFAKDHRDTYFDLEGRLGGLRVKFTAYRAAVCERVVTAVDTVTETVPDPLVVVPLVEVTREVERVEWVCSPLLAEAAS